METEIKEKRKRGRPRKEVRYMEQTTTLAVRVRKVVLERFLLTFNQNKAAAAENGESLFVNNVLQDFMDKYSKGETV